MRYHLLHEILGLAVDGGVVHQNFADISAQVVAQGANDDVAFLVDQERCFFLRGGGLDSLPQMQQIIQIPLQFFLRATHAGGADDQAHPIRDIEAAHHFTDFLAILTLDPPRNAAGAWVVGHQHQIATG